MKRPENPVGKYRATNNCRNFKSGSIVEYVNYEDGNDWFVASGMNVENESNHWALMWDCLEPLEKTLDDLEVGDVLVTASNEEHTVLAICGMIYILSKPGRPNLVSDDGDCLYTLHEIKNLFKFTLKSPTPPKVKVTMEEVAKALGREVGTFEVEV